MFFFFSKKQWDASRKLVRFHNYVMIDEELRPYTKCSETGKNIPSTGFDDVEFIGEALPTDRVYKSSPYWNGRNQ